MGEIEKFILVYIAGATGIWKGVPLGIGLKLNPLYNGLLTGLGTNTTVLILYFAGNSFRQRIFKLYGEKRIEKNKGRFLQFANRYGSWGLGILTPGLLGPFPSLILGLILITDTKKFMVMLITGIFIWSLILAYFFTPLFELITQTNFF
ncbi:MAG: hypothetical protein R2757_20405 [Draconibacterium sp.]